MKTRTGVPTWSRSIQTSSRCSLSLKANLVGVPMILFFWMIGGTDSGGSTDQGVSKVDKEPFSGWITARSTFSGIVS